MALSVIELWFFAAFKRTRATNRFTSEAATETESPSPICSSGLGEIRRGTAVTAMLMAAIRIKVPSTPLEKYSALLCP